MMTPLILKGCKSVQYFITAAAASSTRQHYPGHAGRVAILCALARAAQRYGAQRAYRKHGSSPCASWLIQCEWCNNSQLHEGGKHGVGSNTTGVVPRWRRRRCSGGSPQPSSRATGTKIRVGLIHSCSYYTAYIQTYLLSYSVYGKWYGFALKLSQSYKIITALKHPHWKR